MRAHSFATGEVSVDPPFSEWHRLSELNHEAALAWRFEVAGASAADLRAAARAELLSGAERFSSRLGVNVRGPGEVGGLIVMSGHQPELIHPGVWVKMFLLKRLADEGGATPVNLVVDSDGFDEVSASYPCPPSGNAKCSVRLVSGEAGATFASAPAPGRAQVDGFRRDVLAGLGGLATDVPARMFGRYCDALGSAVSGGVDLAETLTSARRRFEAPADSDYLETTVTSLSSGESFARFVVHIALAAERFASDHNIELAAYRSATGTRSAAQPVPDLKVSGDEIELPFWHLGSRGREPVVVREAPGAVEIRTGDASVAIPPNDPDAAVAAIRSSGLVLVPRALTLTMFARLFACDLMIHGTGGGRYDRVTDGIIRRFFGIEPPRFVTATATVLLPVDYDEVTDSDVAAATERLNRLEHNPDASLADATFMSEGDRERATALAREKAELVARIARPDADKKETGARIRAVNAEISALMEPMRVRLEHELRVARERDETARVLGDRTYPFCYFDPVEIARLVG